MSRDDRSICDAEAGVLLVEFAVGLSVLAVGVLAFMSSFMTNYRAFSTVNEIDEVHVAFETIAEAFVILSPQEVYDNFDGTNVAVPGLVAPGGGAAQVEIDCFIDEDQIPSEFDWVDDIYGNPAVSSAGPLVNLKILPTRLRVTYATGNGPHTRALYVVVGSG